MICPHCTVGEISPDSGQCVLCGGSPQGHVIVDKPLVDETLETVQRELDGRFKIARQIGRGRRSVVFLAQNIERDQPVAVKVIPLQQGLFPDVARFEREAGVASSLNHSHILPIYEFGSTPALLWYSMKYVRGQSLAEILRESGSLDLEACLAIVEQVGSGLDYIHRRGLVHGNVKPSNIIVDENRWARVSDAAVMSAFGSPKGAAERGWIGTPEYAAPERFRARTGSASIDQYALAVVVYECLAGSLPFVGDAMEEIERQHRSEPPPLLSEQRKGIPAHVDDALQRAMSKAVVERFPNVLDFISLLRGDWAPEAAIPVVPEEAAGRPQVVLIDRSNRDDDIEGRPMVLAAPPRRRFPYARFALVILAALLVDSVLLWRRPVPLSVSGPAPRMVTPETFTVQEPPVLPDVDDSLPVSRAVPTRDSPLEQPLADEQGQPPSRVPSVAPEPAQPEPSVPASQSGAQAAARPPTVTDQRPPPVQPTPLEEDAGQLFINSTPWGQLYLDGQLVGNTPKRNLLLRPGIHHIRITRDGYEPFEVEIEVAPRQQVRLTNIVLKAQG